MVKDTKSYRCDGCDKVKVLDFYDQHNVEQMALYAKELASWINLRLSAHRPEKGSAPVIPETVGHACSEKCIKPAIAAMVKKALPE